MSIIDYSYSAYLAYSILTGNARELAYHIQNTTSMRIPMLRAPRTFDGILLQSQNLNSGVVSSLLNICDQYGISPRVIDGKAYELNCSLPYLFSIDVDNEYCKQRMELAIVTTIALPGIAYLYLPFLLGFSPEKKSIQRLEEDPRAINRSQIPISYLSKISAKSIYQFMCQLVDLNNLISNNGKEVQTIITTPRKNILVIYWPEKRIKFMANFSINNEVNLLNPTGENIIFSKRCTKRKLKPLGYVFWYH